MKTRETIEEICALAMTPDLRTVDSCPQRHQANPIIGAALGIGLLHFENNNKPNNPVQLKTSRKFKIASIKNANILGGVEFSGISLKPQLENTQPVLELNGNSKGSIRQSYDSSQKNISLGNLNSIESKKSMRSQQRRRRKSKGEDIITLPDRKKRKDSRLFKKSFGGPTIKLNLNQNNMTLNQNALKNYKLPI